MNLYTKAIIYQYTGIYLAEAEEAAYKVSEEHKTYVASMLSHPENDLDAEDAEGISIGMWQGYYGFHRPMSFLRYRKPSFIFKPLAWFHDLWTVVRTGSR